MTWISSIPILSRLLGWSKKNSFPGFRGVSVYLVAQFLWREVRRNDLNTRANSMAYSFFLALFPFVFFLFTLTAYLPKSLDFYHTLENSILSILPSEAEEYIFKDIIMSIRPKANTSFISLGFLFALIFASNGIMAMMRGFDKTYRTSFKKRKWYETLLVSWALTCLVAVLLIASVVTIIFSEKIIRYINYFLPIDSVAHWIIAGCKYCIIVLLFYSVISMIYRYGPAAHKPIKGISPGAVLATLGSILTSVAFQYFVEHFSSYHKVYGAISALLITLLWIRLNAFILIMGFELNAAIIVNRDIAIREIAPHDDI